MQATENSEKRFQTRMPDRVHDRLQEAARLTGATLNQFIVQSALEKANDVLEKENVLMLSERDAEVFFEALENPPEPNAVLRDTMKQHRDMMSNNDH